MHRSPPPLDLHPTRTRRGLAWASALVLLSTTPAPAQEPGEREQVEPIRQDEPARKTDSFTYTLAESRTPEHLLAELPPEPTVGEILCDLLRPPPPSACVGGWACGKLALPAESLAPAPGLMHYIGAIAAKPVGKPGTAAGGTGGGLQQIGAAPAELAPLILPMQVSQQRIDVPLQVGAGSSTAWIELTVSEPRPVVFALDRSADFTIRDADDELVGFDLYRDPEPDDRLCSQVRTAGVAELPPGIYTLRLQVTGAVARVGFVAMHLPPPPPVAPAVVAPVAFEPPDGVATVNHEGYAFALATGSDLPAYEVARIEEARARREDPGRAGGDPPQQRSGSIPCAYDVRFVSFTPRTAPAGDRRGEFRFAMTVEGNAEETFDFTGSEVDVDQTRFVHGALGTVLAPCDEPVEVALEVTGREVDDWWIFGFANPDEKGTLTATVPLECTANSGDVERTFTLELRNGLGNLKHTVDVLIAFRPYNQAFACAEIAEEGELTACTFNLSAIALAHVESPNVDKNGHFDVAVRVPEGFGRKYPKRLTQSLRVKRGESGDLDLDLESFTVPCGETYEVPLTVQVLERDTFGSEYGAAIRTIPLTCPPAQPLGYKDVPIALDLAQDNGVVKHRVALTARVRSTNSDFCAPVPNEYACRFALTGYDVTHTHAPNSDKKGEFRFTTDLGYGNSTTVKPYDDGNVQVRLNETETFNWGLGTIEVPCGQTVDATLQTSVVELDIVTLWPSNWVIKTPNEYGGTTVPLSFTCPPAQPAAAYSTSVELRNARGNRQHDLDLVFHSDLANPEDACQVIPEPPPPATCDLELDLWSFTHLSSSTGDKDGRFTFEFRTDYLVGGHPRSFRELGFWDVYRGHTRTMAYLVKHTAINEVGASFGDYFRIPVGATVPIRVRIDVEELDFIGDDRGWIETDIGLNCAQATNPLDIELPITINGDKHHGIIRLRVQGH